MKLQSLYSLYFTVISLILSVIFGTYQYQSAKTQYTENLRVRLKTVAGLAAGVLDVEAHATILTPADEENAGYKKIKALLRRIIDANPDIRYVYSLRKGADGSVLFVVDGDDKPESMAHVGDPYKDAPELAKSSVESLGAPTAATETYTDQWGTFLSGYAPIVRADGIQEGVIAVDISLANVDLQLASMLHKSILLSVFLCILGAVLGLLLAKRIVRPIQMSIEHLAYMTRSDLTHELPAWELLRKDELGELLNSSQSVGDNLRRMVTEFSAGIATIKNATGSFATNSLQIQVEANATSTKAAQVNYSSASMDKNLREITQATESMSLQVIAIAAAIGKLTINIQGITKACLEEADAAMSADKDATAAKEVMEQLHASSQRINKVVSTITDIAEQTNLLALNASIEAATAGAAGKGFAVVASEVKTLAAQVSVAAEEIADHIRAMQNDTLKAIDAIALTSSGIDRVNVLSLDVVNAVNDENQTIREIASAVDRASLSANSIATDLGSASKNLQQVTQIFGGIETSAKNTAQGNLVIGDASNELVRLADDLSQVVSQFKM